jgi:hypothetical protein
MNRLLRMLVSTAVLIFTFLIGVSIAHGQITPSADAYTNTAAPTTNYGTAATINVESASHPQGVAFDGTNIWVANHGSPSSVVRLVAMLRSLWPLTEPTFGWRTAAAAL